MRSKVGHAFAAMAVAAVVVLGVAAAPPNDMRLHTDARYRRISMQLERLATQLGLTDQQRARVKPVIEARVQQMHDLRLDENLTDEQREEKVRTVQQTYGSQLRAILTPEQQQKLEEAKESRNARNPVGLRRKGRVPVEND